MQQRIIPALSVSCAFLTFSYMVLIGTTIFFAAWESNAENSLRITQGSIGNLEAQYYTAMNTVTSLNPASLGFVVPTNVQYVAEANTDRTNSLSFNGN